MQSPSASAAYVELPGHPPHVASGCVSKTIDLESLVQFQGPRIFLDFDANDQLIGIEILAWPSDRLG
jgi:hypothetical protein